MRSRRREQNNGAGRERGKEKMQNTQAGQARHAVAKQAILAKLSLFGEAKERRWAGTHANWQKDFKCHSLATGRSETI